LNKPTKSLRKFQKPKKIKAFRVDTKKLFSPKKPNFGTNKAQTNGTNSVYFWHKLGMKLGIV